MNTNKGHTLPCPVTALLAFFLVSFLAIPAAAEINETALRAAVDRVAFEVFRDESDSQQRTKFEVTCIRSRVGFVTVTERSMLSRVERFFVGVEDSPKWQFEARRMEAGRSVAEELQAVIDSQRRYQQLLKTEYEKRAGDAGRYTIVITYQDYKNRLNGSDVITDDSAEPLQGVRSCYGFPDWL